MSKPMVAARSNCASGVGEGAVPKRSDPSSPTSAPQDRGKNSYQEPNAASGRSTQISTGSAVVISSRIGSAVNTGHSSIDRAGPMRSATDLLAVPQRPDGGLDRVRRTADRVAATTRVSSLAPISRSFANSVADWPAATFTSMSLRQVASGSLQACTVKVHRPISSGTTVAVNRLLQSASLVIRISGSGRRLPALAVIAGRACCQSTLAPTRSWPSRKTLAEMVIRSPTTALLGYWPQATRGASSFSPSRPATRQTYRSPLGHRRPGPGHRLAGRAGREHNRTCPAESDRRHVCAPLAKSVRPAAFLF